MDDKRDEMTKYLMSQKPKAIVTERYNNKLPMVFLKKSKESFDELPFVKLGGGANFNSFSASGGADPMASYLKNQVPMVLQKSIERFTEYTGFESPQDQNTVIIPPLNTDIRFSAELPLHVSTIDQEISKTHPHVCSVEDSTLSYALGDTKNYRPSEKEYDHRHKTHPSGLHIHEDIQENFSWAIPTKDDIPLDLVKKSLIHEVTAQHACGSCWAVCISESMSDCFVVSGAVGWAPDISSTFLMASIPIGNNMCGGGQPAAVIPYLEKNGAADSSCIDYSWCSGDDKVCKSISSTQHFDAGQLTRTLNSQIPKNPYGCYFNDVKKWIYKLDPGSDVFYINEKAPIDIFRNTVRSHILDHGPVIGGFVVLPNFTQNFHRSNGGVYFDRAIIKTRAEQSDLATPYPILNPTVYTP